MDWEKEQNRRYAISKYGYREDVVNNPDYFDADTGKFKWKEYAPNDGVVEGTKEQFELQPGDQLVRYDTLDGSYFAPADSKYEELGLPYEEDKIQKTYWEVDKPFTVEKSEVAPTACSEGGGTQYRLNSDENRISEFNEEHLNDGEYIPKKSFQDSPSNLAYEGFIHKIDEQEVGSEEPSMASGNADQVEERDMGIRSDLKQWRESRGEIATDSPALQKSGFHQEGEASPMDNLNEMRQNRENENEA